MPVLNSTARGPDFLRQCAVLRSLSRDVPSIASRAVKFQLSTGGSRKILLSDFHDNILARSAPQGRVVLAAADTHGRAGNVGARQPYAPDSTCLVRPCVRPRTVPAFETRERSPHQASTEAWSSLKPSQGTTVRDMTFKSRMSQVQGYRADPRLPMPGLMGLSQSIIGDADRQSGPCTSLRYHRRDKSVGRG